MPRFVSVENAEIGSKLGWKTAYAIGDSETKGGIAIVNTPAKANLLTRLLNEHSAEIRWNGKPSAPT